MNQVKCYKLVVRTGDDTLVSLYAESLPLDWAVEYVVGEPAYPTTGELFAFDTEASATRLKRTLDSALDTSVELYEALAQPPVRPIDRVCFLGAYADDFYAFWNSPSLFFNTHAAPPGTVTTRSLTLIKRLP